MTNYTRRSERIPDSLKKKKRKPKYPGSGPFATGLASYRGKVATKPKAKPRPKAKKPKTTRRGR